MMNRTSVPVKVRTEDRVCTMNRVDVPVNDTAAVRALPLCLEKDPVKERAAGTRGRSKVRVFVLVNDRTLESNELINLVIDPVKDKVPVSDFNVELELDPVNERLAR
jgi:hypothetical protein